jgi:hypothetical protein
MSNYPPPGMPPSSYTPAPPPPQPSGCGCGGCLGKFFILLGLAFFLILAVCCGGGYYFVQSIKNSTTQQPVEVQAISDEITSMRIPNPPLAPTAGGRYKLPFIGPLGEGAIFSSSALGNAGKNKPSAILIVGSFSDAFGPQFKQQLMQGLESGSHPQNANENDDLNEDLKNPKESIVDLTIRGEAARFHITEGTGVRSGKKKIKVNGTFQGKNGPAILIIMADQATLSREQVDDIIKSIEDGAKGGK